MKTTFLLGIHLHQPVDNFEWVIDKAITQCYNPFFEVMKRYPTFKFSVHCSGWLMERIALLRPSLYQTIQTMAHEGVIELLSAGYYEPILGVIPSSDRVAQIRRLNESIRKRFGQTPQGLWLTERVWESAIIPDMHRAGIRYTVLDDYHFECAGFDSSRLDGYYTTEEGGIEMGLFPISQKLRYAIPFLSVPSAIEAIHSYRRESDSAAILFDDAEKFGMWPGTHEWVYEKKWLENFVEAVLADETIHTDHYGAYFASHTSRGIAYLPNVSYEEMGEWSLRTHDALALHEAKKLPIDPKFLSGGIWKNFLVKYPQSNHIHKRMLELSLIRSKIGKKRFDTALYKLQTNDPLWHGVFGGLYLPNLRDTAYGYLIECENIRYDDHRTHLTQTHNHYPKIKAVTPKLIWEFDPRMGGQLVELDLRDKGFNYQNTLTRVQEAYHQQVVHPNPTPPPPPQGGIDTIHTAHTRNDPKLKEALIYDWYDKNSFIDHISDGGFNLETFYRCNFREYGDFANQPFDSHVEEEHFSLTREGGIYTPEYYSARISKQFSLLASHQLDFAITLETVAQGNFTYIMEHNFHFADYEQVWIEGEPLGEKGSFDLLNTLEFFDGTLHKKITLTTDKPFTLHYFQLQTLSQSEKGFDLSVQGVSVALVFELSALFCLKGSLAITDVSPKHVRQYQR
jgi:hypothetical protein